MCGGGGTSSGGVLGRARWSEAQRGRSAHGVKVGGKTRSGLSLTRPGPPVPFFVGEGDEKEQGRETCFLSLLPKSPLKKKVTTLHHGVRAVGLLGSGGARRGRVTPPSLTSAPSARGARSETQACELEERGARMRALARVSRPFPESVRFPPSPHVPLPPPQSFPRTQPSLFGGGGPSCLSTD